MRQRRNAPAMPHHMTCYDSQGPPQPSLLSPPLSCPRITSHRPPILAHVPLNLRAFVRRFSLPRMPDLPSSSILSSVHILARTHGFLACALQHYVQIAHGSTQHTVCYSVRFSKQGLILLISVSNPESTIRNELMSE